MSDLNAKEYKKFEEIKHIRDDAPNIGVRVSWQSHLTIRNGKISQK